MIPFNKCNNKFLKYLKKINYFNKLLIIICLTMTGFSSKGQAFEENNTDDFELATIQRLSEINAIKSAIALNKNAAICSKSHEKFKVSNICYNNTISKTVLTVHCNDRVFACYDTSFSPSMTKFIQPIESFGRQSFFSYQSAMIRSPQDYPQGVSTNNMKLPYLIKDETKYQPQFKGTAYGLSAGNKQPYPSESVKYEAFWTIETNCYELQEKKYSCIEEICDVSSDKAIYSKYAFGSSFDSRYFNACIQESELP